MTILMMKILGNLPQKYRRFPRLRGNLRVKRRRPEEDLGHLTAKLIAEEVRIKDKEERDKAIAYKTDS